MFEAMKYRWKLRKLEKECDKVQDYYAKLQKKASSSELESLRGEESAEVWPILEEIDSLKTRRFRQLANKLMVPMPDYKDEDLWDERVCGGKNLTAKGFWELKKLIRQEKRERRDAFVVWVAALTGIIGVITGLVPVWKR